MCHGLHATIDASRLPPFDPPWQLATPWNHRGRLYRSFADLLDNPVEPGPVAALVTDPEGPLARTPAPPIPDPFPPGGPWDGYEPRDYLYRLPETVVRLHPFLTAPETHPVLYPNFHNDSGDTEAERYHEWAARLRLDGHLWDWREPFDTEDPRPNPAPWEVQHLLGEANSIR